MATSHHEFLSILRSRSRSLSFVSGRNPGGSVQSARSHGALKHSGLERDETKILSNETLQELILGLLETNPISLPKEAAMKDSYTSLCEQPVQDRERLLPDTLPTTFHWLWSGQAVSLTGSQLSLLSFQLIAANLLHANAIEMGVLTAVQTAPYILCGLFVGVLVDRCSRFRILVGTDLALFGILVATSFLTASGHLNIRLMWAIVGVTSTLNLAFDAGLGAYLTEVVPRSIWLKANSRLSITTSGSAVAGPGIAGYILEITAASTAMSIDAITYLVSAMCLVVGRLRSSARREDRDTSEAR